MLFVGPARAQIDPMPVAVTEGPMFTNEDLDSLVAPIALYPDELLSLVLTAATEPTRIRYWRRRCPAGE